MSGGVAFVWDEESTIGHRVNRGGGSIMLEPVIDHEDVAMLFAMIEAHFNYTRSVRAKTILNNWHQTLPQFVKVVSAEYKQMLAELAKLIPPEVHPAKRALAAGGSIRKSAARSNRVTAMAAQTAHKLRVTPTVED